MPEDINCSRDISYQKITDLEVYRQIIFFSKNGPAKPAVVADRSKATAISQLIVAIEGPGFESPLRITISIAQS